jgi:galactose mutarotase-like enzyme
MRNTHTLSSQQLIVNISESGAELISVQNVETKYEFIWQANPAIWGRHAPVLFPIVGKLNEDKILIDNKLYNMKQHGFARDCRFEPIEIYSNLLKFMLESDAASKEHFPYDFKFFICYELIDNALKITYTVLNTGSQKMFFSVGAHPGFNLPEHNLEKYQILFEKEENLNRSLLTNGLLNGETEKLDSNPKSIDLNRDLFEKDAIVLKSFKSNWIKLVQTNGKFAINMQCDGFPFMGIWTKNKCEEFICLEPWQGIADTLGFEGEIAHKEGIIGLDAGKEISFTYSIQFVAP